MLTRTKMLLGAAGLLLAAYTSVSFMAISEGRRHEKEEEQHRSSVETEHYLRGLRKGDTAAAGSVIRIVDNCPENNSYGICSEAVKALERIGDQRGYEPLEKILDSGDLDSAILWDAVGAITELDGQRSLDHFARRLKNSKYPKGEYRAKYFIAYFVAAGVPTGEHRYYLADFLTRELTHGPVDFGDERYAKALRRLDPKRAELVATEIYDIFGRSPSGCTSCYTTVRKILEGRENEPVGSRD